MGKTLLYQFSILLTLLAFHSILLTTECRQLRSITNPPPAATLSDHEEGSKEDFRPTAPGVSPGVGHPNDDFRPTAPGYSPGVGHSVGLQNRGESYNNDDFRPTAPGFSPGVGHAELTDDSVDAFRPRETEDFKPTQPGHSPGVGHAAVFTSSKRNDDGESSTTAPPSQQKNDFRPTQPGHSPGIGHKN
ncbi:unnamed protein product [Linum tenue]|uniref:Uncharacterized protein n=1 Tax=Linum tenue TaxID=586396 RepID=A0AAV0RBW7_9ROSI|nr:unnamed protein product [Linum tenue]